MLNQKGAVPLLILVAMIGMIAVLSITAVAPFKNNLMSAVFPKELSHAAGSGWIGLLPQINAAAGTTFTTPVMLNTGGGDTVGVDIVLSFDKTALELTDLIIHPENSTLKSFLPVDFSLNPPAFAKDQIIANAKTTGKIAFSAMPIGPTGVFNGSLTESNPLATLQFKVLSNAPASVTFDYTPDSTIDTNMVGPDAVELLSGVTNLSVNGPIVSPSQNPTSGPITPKPGDIDGNNKVDIFDYNQLLTDFGKNVSLASDLDQNGKVDIFDYNILLTNFGS